MRLQISWQSWSEPPQSYTLQTFFESRNSKTARNSGQVLSYY